MELKSIRSSIELKHIFGVNDKLEFYPKYIKVGKFPNLKQLVMCNPVHLEQPGLKMVAVKNLNKLTYENMKNQLRYDSTKF